MSDGAIEHDRILELLQMADASGEIRAQWDVQAKLGFAYYSDSVRAGRWPSREELERLADGDMLERIFLERLTLCGTCGSHAVNVHEACTSCSSSNLAQFRVFFHFRCGFTGPISAFAAEPNGLRCPKCKKLLQDLGTDHDSPGMFFRCGDCASMFQTPHTGVRCVSCGARFTSSALQNLRTVDAFRYRLTNIGRAVLREKRLLSEEEMTAADGSLLRRGSFFESVARARDASERFAVIVVRIPDDEDGASNAARVIRDETGTDAVVGRLDERHVAVLLGEGIERNASRVLKALNSDGAAAMLVKIGSGDSISEILHAHARGIP